MSVESDLKNEKTFILFKKNLPAPFGHVADWLNSKAHIRTCLRRLRY
jgi:hypothetical protein